MLRVEKRSDLAAITGKRAEAPRPVAAPVQDGLKEHITELAKAVQDSAMQTQHGMVLLARAMVESKPEPRAKTLVAEVERDAAGKMVRVVISVER